MSINTQVKGNPGSITAAAGWLTGSLQAQTTGAADALVGAATAPGFEGASADAFGSWAAGASGKIDGVAASIGVTAQALQVFATALRGAQHQMAEIRSEAGGAGLDIAGFVIMDPGPAPAAPGDLPRPAPGQAMDPAVHAQRAAAQAAYADHQRKVWAYAKAQVSTNGVLARLQGEAQTLADSNTAQSQDNSWWLDGLDLGLTAAGGAAGVAVARRTRLASLSDDLARDAKREFRQSKVDRANGAPVTADDVKAATERSTAADKLRDADKAALEDAKRFEKGLSRAGAGLAIVSAGVDIASGENIPKTVVVDGTAFVAATVAGTEIGGAIGGAPGAVAGAAAGAVVGAFTSGAAEAVWDKGPGAALSGGLHGLEDLAGTGVDLVSHSPGVEAIRHPDDALRAVGSVSGPVVSTVIDLVV